MMPHIWSKTAAETATLVQKDPHFSQRGIILIPFPGQDVVVVWVVGNDGGSQEHVTQEMSQARERLQSLAVAELGCGLSQDGHTWAWAGQACLGGNQTLLGQQFYLEMLAATLREVLLATWQASPNDSEQNGWVLRSS